MTDFCLVNVEIVTNRRVFVEDPVVTGQYTIDYNDEVHRAWLGKMCRDTFGRKRVGDDTLTAYYITTYPTTQDEEVFGLPLSLTLGGEDHVAS